jgi:hypothetical protein
MTHWKGKIEYVEETNAKLILPACSIETCEAFKKMFYANQPLLIEESGMIRQFLFKKLIWNEEKKLLLIPMLSVSSSRPTRPEFDC